MGRERLRTPTPVQDGFSQHALVRRQLVDVGGHIPARDAPGKLEGASVGDQARDGHPYPLTACPYVSLQVPGPARPLQGAGPPALTQFLSLHKLACAFSSQKTSSDCREVHKDLNTAVSTAIVSEDCHTFF